MSHIAPFFNPTVQLFHSHPTSQLESKFERTGSGVSTLSFYASFDRNAEVIWTENRSAVMLAKFHDMRREGAASLAKLFSEGVERNRSSFSLASMITYRRFNLP